jgi:hypothetical protein
MEGHIEAQEVGKDVFGHASNGILRHIGKNGISKLREERGEDPRQTD